MSPVAATWVPPHSSVLKRPSPIATTRTRSPYFSPNSAVAPSAIACCVSLTVVWTTELARIASLTIALDPLALLRGDGSGVHEVEAEAVGSDQRPGLLDVAAQGLPQRRVQQVRRGVVAADRIAATCIHRWDVTGIPVVSASAVALNPVSRAAVRGRAGSTSATGVGRPLGPISVPVSDTCPPASK